MSEKCNIFGKTVWYDMLSRFDGILVQLIDVCCIIALHSESRLEENRYVALVLKSLKYCLNDVLQVMSSRLFSFWHPALASIIPTGREKSNATKFASAFLIFGQKLSRTLYIFCAMFLLPVLCKSSQKSGKFNAVEKMFSFGRQPATQETHQEMSWRTWTFYDDVFNHFYAVRPGSYRIWWNNSE